MCFISSSRCLPQESTLETTKNSKNFCQCKSSYSSHIKKIEITVGSCEKWNVIVVPILRFEKNDHIDTLKNLVGSVIGDCKWYYGYIYVQFLTKRMEYFEIKDPIDFTDLNTHVRDFSSFTFLSIFTAPRIPLQRK